MATKKKTKKTSVQPKKSKKTIKPKKAKALKSKPVKKSKPATKSKPTKKTASSKAVLHKVKATKKATPRKRAERTIDESAAAAAFLPESRRSRSGEQSGDLQGLSDREGADSESVDELLDEGNAFEADVVSGVEDADNSDEKEVHTHEVPEDDVPEEYLEKDND